MVALPGSTREALEQCASVLGWQATTRPVGQLRYTCGPFTLDINFDGPEFACARLTRDGRPEVRPVPSALATLYLMAMHGAAGQHAQPSCAMG